MEEITSFLGKPFEYWIEINAVLEEHCITSMEELDLALKEKFFTPLFREEKLGSLGKPIGYWIKIRTVLGRWQIDSPDGLESALTGKRYPGLIPYTIKLYDENARQFGGID